VVWVKYFVLDCVHLCLFDGISSLDGACIQVVKFHLMADCLFGHPSSIVVSFNSSGRTYVKPSRSGGHKEV